MTDNDNKLEIFLSIKQDIKNSIKDLYIQNNLDLIKNKNKLLILVNKNIENLCEHDWKKDSTDTHVYYQCDICCNIKK